MMKLAIVLMAANFAGMIWVLWVFFNHVSISFPPG
jgi:hypothetical protein